MRFKRETSRDSRRAIIDVGSNSVRLVIYDGPARIPYELHNEKVQARLGRGLSETGRIDPEAYNLALGACGRFKALLDASGITAVRTVATAAAREATNGPDLLRDLDRLGLRPELLSGGAEGRASAAGVQSAFPGASGVVADLGGGSLELAEIDGVHLGRSDSVPLGVLRLPALRRDGDRGFAAQVRTLLRGAGWRGAKSGLALFLVGGSWRALGHLDMHLTASAHPGVHGYVLVRDRLKALRKAIAELGPRGLREVPGLTSSRIATLDDAAAVLAAVGEHLGSERMVISSFGLREGLLFEALDETARREDPLLAATADYAGRQGDPRWHGDAIDDWIASVCPAGVAAEDRIRRAACHLAGIDLHPQSDTRARHGMELAWLGAWIGITAQERALLAATLWAAWSGRGECAQVADFLTPEARRLALIWGQSIRLAERLSGGVSDVLRHARLERDETALTLTLVPKFADLGKGVALKQLGLLAQHLDLQVRLRAG